MSETINKKIVDFAKPYGYIYEIKNLINGKIYIGQTTDKKGYRGGMTVKGINHYYKSNYHLINSIKIYGIIHFRRKIIDSAINQDELNKKEDYYIKKYNTINPIYGYNNRFGGKNGKASEETKRKLREAHKRNPRKAFLGKRHSIESKQKMSKTKRESYKNHYEIWEKISKSNKEYYKQHPEAKEQIGKRTVGTHLSEETKQKISNKLKGKIVSSETRKKLSILHKGKKGHIPWNKGKKGVYSEETLKKMSESKKGKPQTEKQKATQFKKGHI